MTVIDFSKSVRRPAQVLSRSVGDEMVILDLVSGTYFGLNAVGSRVWGLLESGLSPDAACAQLASEFDVSIQTLREDVQKLLADLMAQKLLELSDS